MQLLQQASEHYRQQRRQLLWRCFQLQERQGLRILDVGGTPWSSFLRDRQQDQVTYLNLYDPQQLNLNLPPLHRYVQGDARKLPFGDRSFDLVFSNSLIEHVGDFSAQQQVAREIRRVGRAYWVQTPYRHFPWEAHYNFPFFQYLPESGQRWLHQVWPWSWLKVNVADYEHIYLLDRRQMRMLFPDAVLEYEKTSFLIKSLIAIKMPSG